MKEQIEGQTRPGGMSVSDSNLLPAKIRDLDLGCIRYKLLQPESPVKLTPEQAKTIEEEYRKYLALHLLHPDKIIVPDGLVDTFWHQHILDTEKYARDCQEIFGTFVHHFPYFGLRRPEDAADLASNFAATTTLYRETFGEAPPNMWMVAADCGRSGCYVGGHCGG